MGSSTEAVNARLLKAEGPGADASGSTDAFDTGEPGGAGEPAGGGPAKWAGDVGCWYEEKRDKRQNTLEGSNVVVWRELVVSGDLAIDWQEGDTVTFRRLEIGAPLANRGTVQAVEDFDAPPGQPGEVRLTLKNL